LGTAALQTDGQTDRQLYNIRTTCMKNVVTLYFENSLHVSN